MQLAQTDNIERRFTSKPAELSKLVEEAPAPSREWAAGHVDRFLALMFVAPQECAAFDDLIRSETRTF